MPLKIPVLYGTIRDGRKSEAVAKFVHAELVKYGVESAYVTAQDYHGKSIEKKFPEPWKTIMAEALKEGREKHPWP